MGNLLGAIVLLLFMYWPVVVVWVFLGILSGSIARNKGRSFGGWWLYGFCIPVIAIIHALLLTPDRKRIEVQQVSTGALRKCPDCAELVKREAVVCRYCRAVLDSPPNSAPAPARGELNW